jgi:hypothetical protein
VKLIRIIKSKLTMKRLGHNFTGRASGAAVFDYVDCYGVYWLAYDNHWFFRVKKKHQQPPKEQGS